MQPKGISESTKRKLEKSVKVEQGYRDLKKKVDADVADTISRFDEMDRSMEKHKVMRDLRFKVHNQSKSK